MEVFESEGKQRLRKATKDDVAFLFGYLFPVHMPKNMHRKVREKMGFLPFVENDFKAKVANETTTIWGSRMRKSFQIEFLTTCKK